MVKHSGLKAFAVWIILGCAACANGNGDAPASFGSSTSSKVGAGSSAPHPIEGSTAGESESSSAGPTAFGLADRRGDVVSTSKEADWFADATPVPRQAQGDIVGIRVLHTATEIQLRVRFAYLPPQFLGRLDSTVTTDTALHRTVELWVGSDDPTTAAISMRSSDAESVACRMGYSIDNAKGLVTEHIPRECLSNPQWVRVGIDCVAFPADGTTMTLDDALRNGYDANGEDHLSPSIYER